MLKRIAWLLASAVLPLLVLFTWTKAQSPAETGAAVLIDAVLYDGVATGDLDEAVRLRNVSEAPVDMSGWKLTDFEGTAVFPDGIILAPGQAIWIARNAEAFRFQFGFWPDFEVSNEEEEVPNLTGAWGVLANVGDQVALFRADDTLEDCMAYKGNYQNECGLQWIGPTVMPYTVPGVFGEEGQILYRKRDPATGLPVPDTNTAADWAQSREDVINGRKVKYPGWQLDTFFWTAQLTETAVLTVAVAPDNAYDVVVNQINLAQSHIQIESHTFEHVAIAQALIEALGRGVEVTVLLEGGPPGGLHNQGKYVCQQLEAAGGQCWFMITDGSQDIQNRYRFLHAKFMLIDGQRVVISSENLSPNSLPDDDKTDGTWGRRGVLFITDAPGVVAHAQKVFDLDFDPDRYADLFRWQADHPTYGPPPLGFAPDLETGGVTYTVRFPQPAAFKETFAFEIVQSPENSLRAQEGLLGLVNRAGAGDVLLVQQLAERPYWGPSSSNPLDDPNPRLEAYLNAARRGANVRLLLDEFFDSGGPTSNSATCAYVNGIAQAAQLALACRLANPTGMGIHNKMVLAQINGRGYAHVGSLNGTEQSNKGNRELALQVQSDDVYAYLAALFDLDWPEWVHLPIVYKEYVGPATHVLISEILYDPHGPDDAEFVELVNPTAFAIDLSDYALGDAVHPDDFEGVHRFPPGTLLPPGQTLVVATTATGFRRWFNFDPDFEILPSDPAVPVLIRDFNWGHPNSFMQLANDGDEVILRDPQDGVVDVVTYGKGHYPGVVPCPLVSAPHRSLQRYPYWRNTGNCAVDFREWAFPNPGVLP